MSKRRTPYYERQASNPLRPPDWRWQRASAIVTAGVYYSRKRDDEETGVAVQYLRELRRSATRFAREVTLQKFAYLSEAEAIHNRATLQRLEIECRILAGQSDVAIENAMDVFAATVQAYHDQFFDVRRCLQARSFMANVVLSTKRTDEPAEWDLARRDAWRFGPEAVQIWLDYFRSGGIVGPRLTEMDRMTIALRIAHDKLEDDDKVGECLLKHPDVLCANLTSDALPRSISAVMADWSASRWQSVPLPREDLRRCSYGPTQFFRRRASISRRKLKESQHA